MLQQNTTAHQAPQSLNEFEEVQESLVSQHFMEQRRTHGPQFTKTLDRDSFARHVGTSNVFSGIRSLYRLIAIN